MNRQIITLLIAGQLLSGCVAAAVVGGGAAVGSAVSDERSIGRHADDVAIASKIDARLIAERDMPSRWVSVEVINGVATLTGYLYTQEQIDRAIYICKNVEGVRDVKSELHIGRPSTKSLFSDSWITAKVKAGLLSDRVTSGFGIHVETVNGRVYLQGILNNSEQRYRAKLIARNVSGVTAVVDLLQVK